MSPKIFEPPKEEFLLITREPFDLEYRDLLLRSVELKKLRLVYMFAYYSFLNI
jgi:hypothetical protein